MLAVGVGLTAACGIAAGWLATAAGHQVEVLAAARPIAYGHIVSDADLTVAHLSRAPALNAVRAGRRDRVVGEIAAVDLRRGQLLTADSLTNATPPGPGQQLVGVALKVTQLPSGPLHPRDSVLFVQTPPDSTDATAGAAPSTVAATVLRAGASDLDGVVVVDVLVAETDGPTLSTWAAAGRVALIVQPRTG